MIPRPRARFGLAALGVALLCAAALWLLAAFRPDAGPGEFTSDSAIPVIMANARSLTPYHLYYFGQDRFGGWPFVLAWILGRGAGFAWSPLGLYVFQWLALMTASYPAARLAGRWALALVAAVVAIASIASTTVLEISQPYGWQVSSFLWAWWLLRRAVRLASVQDRRWRVAVALAVAVSGLAVWTSMLSFLALLLVGAAELAAAAGSFGGRVRAVASAALAPAVGGLAVEGVVRLVHSQYARRNGLDFQRTAIGLDLPHLAENLRGMLGAQLGLDAWWLPVGNLALAVPVVVLLLARRRTGEVSSDARDLAALGLGGLCVGAACFANFALFSWGRINGYVARYLSFSQFLWALGAVACALFLAERLAPGLRPRAVGILAAVATLGFVARLDVSPPPNVRYQAVQRAARAISERARGRALLGGYWGAYLYAGFPETAETLPVVADGQQDRTPFARSALTGRILVSHEELARFAPTPAPAPFLFERGALLRLLEARAVEHDGQAFSEYERIDAGGAPELRLGGAPVEGAFALDRDPRTTWRVAGWTAPGAALDVVTRRSTSLAVVMLFDALDACSPFVPGVVAQPLLDGLPTTAAVAARGGRGVLALEIEGEADGLRLTRTPEGGEREAEIRELFVISR